MAAEAGCGIFWDVSERWARRKKHMSRAICEEAPVPTPKAALLLIDLQKAGILFMTLVAAARKLSVV